MALARPGAYHAVSSAFNKIPILNANLLYRRRCSFSVLSGSPGSSIPMTSVSLVVDFHHILASGRHYVSCVEHHACDGIVVGIGIENSTSTKVPYLNIVSIYFVCVEYVEYGGNPYPYAPVGTTRDQMSIVKLETSHRSGMTDKAAMNLTTS